MPLDYHLLAFYKRGAAAGPKVFITDDAAGTINTLKNVWPSALHILCQWHYTECCLAFLQQRQKWN